MEILELQPGDDRLPEVWKVMCELRTHRTPHDLDDAYADAHPSGYRVAGLWDEGECRAASGYRYGLNFAHGLYLYVEDLATAAASRSKGYGGALLRRLVDDARKAGCDCVTLDSGVQRFGAHKFYLREGFVISSHHFHLQLRQEGGA